MKIKTLSPIKETPADYEAIKRRIMVVFREEIYLPLLRDLKFGPEELDEPEAIQNEADSEVAKAIEAGTIGYRSGAFYGQFSSQLTKEFRAMGAKWDRASRTFKIAQSRLPAQVRASISISKVRFEEALARVDARLAKGLPPEFAKKLSFQHLFEKQLYKYNGQVKDTLRGITVAPRLTPDEAKKVSAMYSENLELYIQEFADQEIIELRKQVATHTQAGFRYESLARDIQKSYGVSERKAKFLARQETSLMRTAFEQTRYQSVGLTDYIWETVKGSANHPVRPMHKIHEGKRFSFNKPPVVNKKGERKNPGQDYNCRCTARVIVKLEE